MEMKVWVWLKKKTIDRALEALLRVGDDEHQKARECVGKEADEHRAEAEKFHAAKHDLWSANHEIPMINCPDESITAHPHANVNKTLINVSEKGVVMLAVAVSMGLAAYAAARVDALKDHISENQRLTQLEVDHYKEEYIKLDRQYRMTELKLDDWTVVAHRSGLVLPGDYTRGPQGNLDEESFKTKPKGK